MKPTYSIFLWDHNPRADEPFDYPRHWSTKLAAEHLQERSTGLSLREVGRAIRKLREGWSNITILVEREDVEVSRAVTVEQVRRMEEAIR